MIFTLTYTVKSGENTPKEAAYRLLHNLMDEIHKREDMIVLDAQYRKED